MTASGASTRRSARGLTWLAIVGVFLVVLFLALRHAASFLVVNAPERADAILVLEGGGDGSRYWKAVELAKQGYAQHILVDANSQGKQWGVVEADLAAAFIERVTPGMAEVCPITADSTFEETADVRPCLARLKASSVLIVTSNYHTRRALSIFRKRLPQYRWSVAASNAPSYFADRWWQHRRWAKWLLDEWEKLLWWELVDRWRPGLTLR